MIEVVFQRTRDRLIKTQRRGQRRHPGLRRIAIALHDSGKLFFTDRVRIDSAPAKYEDHRKRDDLYIPSPPCSLHITLALCTASFPLLPSALYRQPTENSLPKLSMGKKRVRS